MKATDEATPRQQQRRRARRPQAMARQTLWPWPHVAPGPASTNPLQVLGGDEE